MFKKIMSLMVVATLPMLACGPTIDPEGLAIALVILVIGFILTIYGLVQLAKGDYRIFISYLLATIGVYFINPLIALGMLPVFGVFSFVVLKKRNRVNGVE